jgi:hypothetical protein
MIRINPPPTITNAESLYCHGKNSPIVDMPASVEHLLRKTKKHEFTTH